MLELNPGSRHPSPGRQSGAGRPFPSQFPRYSCFSRLCTAWPSIHHDRDQDRVIRHHHHQPQMDHFLQTRYGLLFVQKFFMSSV